MVPGENALKGYSTAIPSNQLYGHVCRLTLIPKRGWNAIDVMRDPSLFEEGIGPPRHGVTTDM
jgi:hypothetical protein